MCTSAKDVDFYFFPEVSWPRARERAFAGGFDFSVFGQECGIGFACEVLELLKMKVHAIVVLLVGLMLAGLVGAAADKAQGKIRYKPGWVEAMCELENVDVLEAEKRKDERRDFFDHPYPKEIENYAPEAFEYAEHILTGIPCYATPRLEIRLPSDFRCRLDRMIFRDPENGEELSAEGGGYKFVFVYLDQNDEAVEETPRPLNAGGPTLAGYILVRGSLKGHSYTVVREWIDGSPSEATASRLTDPNNPSDAVLPVHELPFVTQANASMFVIDLRNEMPLVKELSGGPLKEYQFIPSGCQN